MKDRSHFVITLLTDKFPQALRLAMEYIVALGASFLLGIVIVKGWGLMLLNRNQESPALEIPMSVPYAAIPVGFMLMLIFLWTGLLIHRFGGDEPRQEKKEASPETITEGLL
jgi:TRAP-type C4-dicarboxylate transport system permease small subunit